MTFSNNTVKIIVESIAVSRCQGHTAKLADLAEWLLQTHLKSKSSKACFVRTKAEMEPLIREFKAKKREISRRKRELRKVWGLKV